MDIGQKSQAFGTNLLAYIQTDILLLSDIRMNLDNNEYFYYLERAT